MPPPQVTTDTKTGALLAITALAIEAGHASIKQVDRFVVAVMGPNTVVAAAALVHVLGQTRPGRTQPAVVDAVRDRPTAVAPCASRGPRATVAQFGRPHPPVKAVPNSARIAFTTALLVPTGVARRTHGLLRLRPRPSVPVGRTLGPWPRLVARQLLVRTEVAVPVVAAERVRAVLEAVRSTPDAWPAIAATDTDEGQEVVGAAPEVEVLPATALPVVVVPRGPAAVGCAGAGLPVRRGRALLSVAVRRLLLPSGPPTANAPRGPLRVPAAPVPVVGPVLVRASRRRVGLPIVRVSRHDGKPTPAAINTAAAALPGFHITARVVRADAPLAFAAVVIPLSGLRLYGAAPTTP